MEQSGESGVQLCVTWCTHTSGVCILWLQCVYSNKNQEYNLAKEPLGHFKQSSEVKRWAKHWALHTATWAQSSLPPCLWWWHCINLSLLLSAVTVLCSPLLCILHLPPEFSHQLNRVCTGESSPPAPTLMHTQSGLLIMQIKYSNITPLHLYPALFQHKKEKKVTNPPFITRNINYM